MTIPDDPHRDEKTPQEAEKEFGYELSPEDLEASVPASDSSSSSTGGKSHIDRPSILSDDGDASGDRCLNCGAAMAAEGLLCMACGYDHKQNKVVTSKVGKAVEVDTPGEFCVPGRGGWRTPLIAGGVCVLLAAVFAAIHADAPSFWRRLPYFFKAAVYGPVYAGFGVVAVVAVAKALGDRVGRLEFAAGRMLLAVGLMMLGWQLAPLVVTDPLWVRNVLGVFLGSAGYAGAVWLLFSVTRQVVGLLAIAHLVLWFLFWLVRWLELSTMAAAIS